MIENNIERDQRDLQRARRRGVAPSSSLRRHFFALARQVNQWAQMRDRHGIHGGSMGCEFSIGVTSLDRGAGRSTVSFNLASSLAALKRTNGLLVEADFGKHFVTRRLGFSRSPGLSELLLGVAEIQESVFQTPLSDLSVMGCGRKSDQEALELPFDLLPNLINDKLQDFGFLVFDLPLANHLTTCHSILPHLDGVILAVESSRIDHNEIDRFRKQVEANGVEIIGVVLNKA